MTCEQRLQIDAPHGVVDVVTDYASPGSASTAHTTKSESCADNPSA
ncbi:hypothetical protein [Streptomyces pseudoechinosporeus]